MRNIFKRKSKPWVLLYTPISLGDVVGTNIVGLTARVECYVVTMYLTIEGEIIHVDDKVISIADWDHDNVVEVAWYDVCRVWVKP